MDYNQPYGTPAGSPYVNGNPATGVQGSIPPAAAFEAPQREIVNLITKAGMTPSSGDLQQFAKAIQSGLLQYGTDTGSANALAVTMTQTPDTYPRLLMVKKGANANTGAMSIAVNTLAVVPVIAATGAALLAGAWPGNGAALLVFDGANYQLVSVTTSAVADRDFYLIDTPLTKTVHGTTPDFADLTAAFYWLSRYRITNNGSVTFNIRAGQFSYGTTNVLLDHPNSDRVFINGATLLATPISSATFPSTGSSAAARSADRVTQLAKLRAIYATELQFTGSAGITVARNGSIWQRLLISSDRSGSNNAALFTAQTASVTIGDISAVNGGGYGIAATQGLIFVATRASGSGCVISGIGASDGGGVLFGTASTFIFGCTNDAYGIRSLAAVIRGNAIGTAIASGNGAHGIAADTNGQFECGPGSSSTSNAGNGLYASSGRIAVSSGFVTSANGQWGVNAVEHAQIMAAGIQVGSNTLGSIASSNGSEVNATGGTGVTGSSPALNVIGNGNAIIVA
jgi:hypothetical protein